MGRRRIVRYERKIAFPPRFLNFVAELQVLETAVSQWWRLLCSSFRLPVLAWCLKKNEHQEETTVASLRSERYVCVCAQRT
jgi:hypothetical protein